MSQDSLRTLPSPTVNIELLKQKEDLAIGESIGLLLPSDVSSLDSDQSNDDDDDDDDDDNDALNSSNDNLLQVPDEELDDDKLRSISPNSQSQQNLNLNTSNTSNSTTSTTSNNDSNNSNPLSHESRGLPSSCVFVASLTASLSDDELCLSVTDYFKTFGALSRVKVLRDNANRPYAFVQFTNDKDAKNALMNAQGTILNGRRLRCEPARVNRTLFLRKSHPISFNEVSEICGKFGGLEQIVPNLNDDNHFVKRYSNESTSVESWFVQFTYRDDAIRAYANLRTDLTWIIEWAQNINVPKNYNFVSKIDNNNKNSNSSIATLNGSNNSSDSTNHSENNRSRTNIEDLPCDDSDSTSITIDKKSIFVGQLDRLTTRELLDERFSTHGIIIDINLIFKPTNIFAFIQFKTEEAAAAALERENHAIFLNKTMHVQYKEIGGRHGRKYYGRQNNNYDIKSKSFNGPSLKIAPPPINAYRKMQQGPQIMGPPLPNDGMMPPSMPMSVLGGGPGAGVGGNGNDYEMFQNTPYMRGKMALRRKSLPSTWSSSKSVNSELDNTSGDGNSELNSELLESTDQVDENSVTTYNSSSGYNPDNESNINQGFRKRFTRHLSYGYNEPPKYYYFQPYYYQPMQYPMRPMHPSQGNQGNQQYMMVYPMPPQQSNGMDNTMLPPPLSIGQNGTNVPNMSPMMQPPFMQPDCDEVGTDKKSCNLDY